MNAQARIHILLHHTLGVQAHSQVVHPFLQSLSFVRNISASYYVRIACDVHFSWDHFLDLDRAQTFSL